MTALFHPRWYDWLAWPLVLYAIVASVVFLAWFRPVETSPPLRSRAITAARWTVVAVAASVSGILPRLLPWVPDARFLNLFDVIRSLAGLTALDVLMTLYILLRRDALRAHARLPEAPGPVFDDILHE